MDGDYAISFHDLIEVYVAGQLRDHGVALQTVRKVHQRLETDFHTPHPFCRQELLTDGRKVFLHGLDSEGQEQSHDALTGQGVFADILAPFLKKIDYDKAERLARKWHIASGVVLDPAICFGAPVVEEVNLPTSSLATAYRANGEDAAAVARWYGVEPRHVLAAVEFQRGLAA